MIDFVVLGIVVFLAAGALTVALTTLQIRLDHVVRLTAIPRGDRWHRRPTPSSGGIAILGAAAVVYCAGFRGKHVSIVLGALALWLLGLIDDRLRLGPAAKFVGQSIICACVVASGVVFHATASHPLNLIISFLWLAGITNAFNLIDNMDGLCAGVTVIIAGFRYSLLAARGDWDEANLCALIGGLYAGFLMCNYRPAKIFMGDCGSMLAGFSLAALAIATPIPHTKSFAAGLFYPVLTFAYPIFDTTLVSVLRKLAGRPISMGGRDHSSHRLVLLGLSETSAIWILWALAALGSGIGLMVDWMPAGLIVAGSVLLAGLAAFGRFLAGVPVDLVKEPSRRIPAAG